MTDTQFTVIQTEAADPAACAIIEAAGGRVIVQRVTNQEERAVLLKDAQCVLVSAAPITDDLLDRLPKLQLIIRGGVGLDTLDIPAATARAASRVPAWTCSKWSQWQRARRCSHSTTWC